MNAMKNFREIHAHITPDNTLSHGTRHDIEIIAVALRHDRDELICLARSSNQDSDWVVGIGLGVWEGKVCWDRGDYFDTGYSALRHFNVLKVGKPVWSNRKYSELLDDFDCWGGRIRDPFDISSRLWELHSAECRRRDVKDSPIDLASYEALTAMAMKTILYNVLILCDDADTAYRRWLENDADVDLEKAFERAYQWVE